MKERPKVRFFDVCERCEEELNYHRGDAMYFCARCERQRESERAIKEKIGIDMDEVKESMKK